RQWFSGVATARRLTIRAVGRPAPGRRDNSYWPLKGSMPRRTLRRQPARVLLRGHDIPEGDSDRAPGNAAHLVPEDCSLPKSVTPVTLPPGFARLITRPEPTGSETLFVARSTARAAGVESARITSGLRATARRPSGESDHCCPRVP